jgi:hypothetical protein
MSTEKRWRNRIVGEGEEAPQALVANPHNWRAHPKHQQAALAGVLSEVGWVQRVIVNRRTGHIIDGHLRVSLALSRHEPAVPVLYVDLEPAEEKLILATLDPLGAMAEVETERLASLIQEVQSQEIAVTDMVKKLALDTGIMKLDPYEAWQGMPIFEQPEASGFQIIHVHFESREARDDFAQRLGGLQLTDRTRYLWWPPREERPSPELKRAEHES